MLLVVRQLLGEGEVQEEDVRTRGVYCTMPYGNKLKARNQSHVDSSLDSRQRIGVVTYIDNVAPGGGSFMVWPGSHHYCHRFLATQEDTNANGYQQKEKKNLTGGPDDRPSWAAGMQAAWELVEKTIYPVDCFGAAGDVVFYHSHLAHMAGQNYSANIRQAVISGFSKTADALPDDELIAHALEADIWRDWSALVRRSGDDHGRVGPMAVQRSEKPSPAPIWYSRL